MNTGSVVAIVVVLVVAGLAWLFLKGRKRDDIVAPPPVATDELVEPAAKADLPPPEAIAAPVMPPPAPTAEKVPPPAVRSAPPPAPRPSAPPPESVTVIMARPRPPVPLVERVLALEKVDDAEWDAARPLALSAVQSAAVASAMTAAATQPRPGESALHAVRFDAGSAIRIARGDIEAIRAIAAAGAASAQGKGRWLDSAAATALAATALAALASERWLDGLGDEMRDLKAALAALPPKLAAQNDGRLKALVQDLSRFAREARDNYVSVIGKFAFRERVGEGCERAAALWHELVGSADAARQELELVAATPRFGEAQIDRSLSQWRELQGQQRLLEIAARVLAGMHTLRLALGDAASGAEADPLASAVASLQSGLDQDRDLAARLAEREKGAKGDPYVGRGEFEANRATLRKLLDKLPAEAMTLAMHRLEAAAATEPLDAGTGGPSRLLVLSASGEGAGSLRWSSVPRPGQG